MRWNLVRKIFFKSICLLQILWGCYQACRGNVNKIYLRTDNITLLTYKFNSFYVILNYLYLKNITWIKHCTIFLWNMASYTLAACIKAASGKVEHLTEPLSLMCFHLTVYVFDVCVYLYPLTILCFDMASYCLYPNSDCILIWLNFHILTVYWLIV